MECHKGFERCSNGNKIEFLIYGLIIGVFCERKLTSVQMSPFLGLKRLKHMKYTEPRCVNGQSRMFSFFVPRCCEP